MTQQQKESLVDEITQAQQEIEAQQQQGAQQPQYLTQEQAQQLFRQQMQEMLQPIGRQIAGLQSKMDSGLNAVRRDTMEWAKAQIGDLQTRAGRDKFLAGLDEEQRKIAEPLLQYVDSKTASAPQERREEATPAADQSRVTSANDLWEQVYQIVEGFGLKRDNPGIDYVALTQPGIDDKERQTRFLGSISKVLKGDGSTTQTSNQSTSRQTQTNPRVDSTPRGTQTTYRNVDDVRSAFLIGRLDKDEYRKRMQALGESV